VDKTAKNLAPPARKDYVNVYKTNSTVICALQRYIESRRRKLHRIRDVTSSNPGPSKGYLALLLS
jgi:hypothetical protein